MGVGGALIVCFNFTNCTVNPLMVGTHNPVSPLGYRISLARLGEKNFAILPMLL
ncbi:Uncharacterised protein [Vibrio cholerae]|uniref:Uncharacterized protein n=1 Tax=Vibrio cholerae TaxID=666 RepID=A0A655UJD5_VIBCL|nr:Uncharacterised protein [Vibrio cholerae]CRZ86179.1 Uncharacterised protein [Vibrio cholerae]CRZ94916.1 Uncharacterised protein [Vibrio cholerae]CSA55227.1 Uncharacterised protein [Vibrio cholerae]CSA78425.1 Uncharacterised protein [Vibrio cholerae]